MTEECFVTHNYVTNGDFVTVRMEVPVVQQEAVDEEEHPDLENNQNIEKSVLAEKKITEPKISEQKDAEPVQNLESAEIPLEPEMRRWMAGLNVGIPFFWGTCFLCLPIRPMSVLRQEYKEVTVFLNF